jgi:hypothetical protein
LYVKPFSSNSKEGGKSSEVCLASRKTFGDSGAASPCGDAEAAKRSRRANAPESLR